ncbi:MAG TPA: glycosyltransferase family 39 protein [Candidatus Limnocylindria bacterium]|nr:glycosyltransferase family 39 protein [Candidatus Limnocylindria bacterium]
MQRSIGVPDRRPRIRGPARVRPWLLLFSVALVLRIAYAWLATGPDAQPYSDAADYDAIAWNLANDRGFSLGESAAPYPTAYRPPVVPWLTSLLYRAIGHEYFAAVLLQCVIGACVPLVLGRFAAAIFGGVVGELAAWLAALNPLLVFFSGYLMTEIPFTAILLLALFATTEWVKTPRTARALGVGMLWGVASLTRPTALALPALVALWAWVPLGLSVAPRERTRQVVLVALGLVLVIGPWTIRNALALRAFVPVTTGGGRAFLDSNNPLVWNDPARRGGAVSTYHLEPYAQEFSGLSEVEADALAARRGREFLAARVPEWPAMALAKLGRFWRLGAEAGGTGTWRRPDSPLGALTRRVDPLVVWSLVTLPFAIWGTVRVLRGPRRWFQSLTLLVILYFTVLAVVYWGSLRSRVAIEPLFALLAAVGIDDMRRRLRARASGLRVVSARE